jgi:hypothetical protein
MASPDRVRMRDTPASPVARACAYSDAPRCRSNEFAAWLGTVQPHVQFEFRVT